MTTILKIIAAWIGTGIVIQYFGIKTMLIIMAIQLVYVMMSKD